MKNLLTYDLTQNIFSYKQEDIDGYIRNWCKNHADLNETQVQLLGDVIFGYVELVNTNLQHYPGSIAKLLKDLKAVNENQIAGGKENSTTWATICAWGKRGEHPLALRQLFFQIPNFYSICRGKLSEIKLSHRLQKSFYINPKQVTAAHKFLDEILSDAIDTIEASDEYKQAIEKNSLYFISNLLPESSKDTVAFNSAILPSKEELVQLHKLQFKEVENSEKRNSKSLF